MGIFYTSKVTNGFSLLCSDLKEKDKVITNYIVKKDGFDGFTEVGSGRFILVKSGNTPVFLDPIQKATLHFGSSPKSNMTFWISKVVMHFGSDPKSIMHFGWDPKIMVWVNQLSCIMDPTQYAS